MAEPQRFIQRVEAMRYLKDDVDRCVALNEWMGYEHEPDDGTCGVSPIAIDTGMGQVDLCVGDWLVSDGHGFYPCKPDIFEATYEPEPPTFHFHGGTVAEGSRG